MNDNERDHYLREKSNPCSIKPKQTLKHLYAKMILLVY